MPRSTCTGPMAAQLACAPCSPALGPMWTSRPTKIRYCVHKGRSSPSWARMRATSAGRACGPATARAGSVGRRWLMKKARVTTAHSVKSDHASRVVTWASISAPPFRHRTRPRWPAPGSDERQHGARAHRTLRVQALLFVEPHPAHVPAMRIVHRKSVHVGLNDFVESLEKAERPGRLVTHDLLAAAVQRRASRRIELAVGLFEEPVELGIGV